MLSKMIKVFSVALTVCLLLTVLPVGALAEGCKWHGETLKYIISPTTLNKIYNVNCDSTYTIDIKFDESPLYPTSRGYINNWAKVSYSNKSQLKLSFERNYSSSRRSCKVILTCDTHYSTKTLIITQNAGTDKTPTISLSTNRITVAPGEQVQFKITAQNCRRIFVDLMTSGIQTYNIPLTTSTSKSTKSISFNVPQDTPIGAYRLYIEASNSPKENDAWARRTSKKYVDILVQAPVSAPEIKNTNTGTVFNPNQTTDYNPADGNLKLSWSAENGCGYYKVVIIGLNEAPDFGDSSQLSRAAYTYRNSNKASITSISIPATKMKSAPYMKIAIGAYQRKTDTTPAKWTNVGVKVSTNPQYDANKATQYALKWGGSKRNSEEFPVVPGNDCCNFVSQCLYTGGIQMDEEKGWYCYGTDINNAGEAWRWTNSLLTFLESLGFKGKTQPSSFSEMHAGDIIWCQGNGGYQGHVMIVTGVGSNYFRFTAHTNDKLNVASYDLSWLQYWISMT